jgi:ribosomal protein S12 methylthiotransferase
MQNVFIKNLGCPKNEVDGNVLLRMLEAEGMQTVKNPKKADLIIVNTCGFIDPAKEESIDEILAMAKLKEKRKAKLVMAGCLAQRYKDMIQEEFPEVDLVVGIANLSHAKDKILGMRDGKKVKDSVLPTKYKEYDFMQKPGGMPYAYLKISDGCDNFCSYCTIPFIRGRYRSRKVSKIVDEAKYLTEQGASEIMLIAQDSTQYGVDIYGKQRLHGLLEKLEQVEGVKWIRLMYTHPAHYYKELIDYLAKSEKVVPYLDLPIQHISDRILKEMNRKITAKQMKNLINRLRKKIKNLVLRTTYIIGFPTETKEEFQELWDFQKEYKIERVGVFAYSREEVTPSATMNPQITEKVTAGRIDELMMLVMGQSMDRNAKLLGKKVEVLIDEKHKDGYYIGRAYDQAPEIDGYIKVKGKFKPGRFYNVRITGFEAYDLSAEEWKE